MQQTVECGPAFSQREILRAWLCAFAVCGVQRCCLMGKADSGLCSLTEGCKETCFVACRAKAPLPAAAAYVIRGGCSGPVETTLRVQCMMKDRRYRLDFRPIRSLQRFKPAIKLASTATAYIDWLFLPLPLHYGMRWYDYRSIYTRSMNGTAAATGKVIKSAAYSPKKMRKEW